MWRVVPWLLAVGGQVQDSRLCILDCFNFTFTFTFLLSKLFLTKLM
jgi:hypothetical protein